MPGVFLYSREAGVAGTRRARPRWEWSEMRSEVIYVTCFGKLPNVADNFDLH